MYRFSANQTKTAKVQHSVAVLTLVLIQQSVCMDLRCKTISVIMDLSAFPDAVSKRNVPIPCNVMTNAKPILTVCKMKGAVVMNFAPSKLYAKETRQLVTIVTKIVSVSQDIVI